MSLPVILSDEFNFPELLKMAAEQEGKEGKGVGNEVEQGIATQHCTIGTAIDDIHTLLGPAMAPSFQPKGDPPSYCKQGSHGQCLGKLGGGANLPRD